MTFVTRLIVCPFCGDQEPRSIAVSINAGKRPDVVAAIVADRFQSFVCGSCGEPYVVEDPFIYLDFERKFWVACLPSRGEVGWHRYEQESQYTWEENMLRNAPPIVRVQAGGFAVRTVFGLAALRDKLVALCAGLDDRWLEVLKLVLMREIGEFSAASRPRLWKVEAGKLWFTVRGKADHLVVDRSRYTSLKLEPLEWITALEVFSKGPYVDMGRLLIGGEKEVSGVSFPWSPEG